MTTYQVYYSRSLGMESVQADDGKTNLHFSSARSVRISKEAFARDYVYLGLVRASGLEAAWALLNDADPDRPNPLGAPQIQELIRRERLHTSMSVGDMLRDEQGKMHVTMGVGFANMEVVG